jgi:putative chitinase
MQITTSIIVAGCGAALLRSAQWTTPLQTACDAYQINTPLRVAAFLATCGVECARLTALVENMNYSAAGLESTFGKYFTADEIPDFANKPPMIANRVYANRNGNGDEASGDGWLYRGRAVIGITGRTNYTLCALGVDLDLLNHPELLEQDANAAMAGAWYWSNNNLNSLADAGNFLGVSKAVNLGSPNAPGTPGSYSERLALYTAAKQALGIA